MKRKETEFLTEEEPRPFSGFRIEEPSRAKRDYAIFLTLLTTGLRKAEICSL
jgi:integrase